jgi:molecular chaperone GrpE
MSDPTPPDAPSDRAPSTPEGLLAAATAKAEENYGQYVRVLAEFDNYRKRSARDLDQARQFAVERFAQELLPAMDGFELALATAARADVKSLLEGQDATRRLLAKAFEKAGITELVPARGQAFNPEHHEAMVAQPTADLPPNAIVQTIQKGYALNGRVLRPARVIVARAPDA